MIDNLLDVLATTKRRFVASFWWTRFKSERKYWVDKTISLYSDSDRYKNEIAFLKKHGAEFFPYDWSLDKKTWKVKAGGYRVGSSREPYVVHKGKKLYMNLRDYTQLLLEQDPKSPHRYFTDSFKVEKGDIFVDVGGAEGMISLDVIDAAGKIYILECDELWKRKLEKTFAPYMDKVTIISKYASNKCDGINLTLDSLLMNETDPVVIKMDVEGMEEEVLEGAKEVISRPDTKVAVCTYHRAGDDEKFEKYFKDLGYETEFSEGYMAMLYDDNNDGRFRKAMLRAWKKRYL